jgi:hypothetical protein
MKVHFTKSQVSENHFDKQLKTCTLHEIKKSNRILP